MKDNIAYITELSNRVKEGEFELLKDLKKSLLEEKMFSEVLIENLVKEGELNYLERSCEEGKGKDLLVVDSIVENNMFELTTLFLDHYCKLLKTPLRAYRENSAQHVQEDLTQLIGKNEPFAAVYSGDEPSAIVTNKDNLYMYAELQPQNKGVKLVLLGDSFNIGRFTRKVSELSNAAVLYPGETISQQVMMFYSYPFGKLLESTSKIKV